MNYWARASRTGKRTQLDTQLKLSNAYRSVFAGTPDRQQQQMVLADLAAVTGYYGVSPEGTTSEQLAYREGKRAAFAAIVGHLTLSPEDMLALENAARHETLDIHNSQN